MSGTSWYPGIPRFQYGVRSDSPPPTSKHKSGGLKAEESEESEEYRITPKFN